MTSTQLLKSVAPELQHQIIGYLQSEQRPVYRAVIQNLTQARKLRPVYIQSKSRAEQATWVLEQLRFSSNQDVTSQILQLWLLKAKPEMLITFLDAAGISHDGKGEVEALPDELEPAKAEAAVLALLEKYPAQEVAVYLHLFQMQKEGGWPTLQTAMESHQELALNS